MNFNFDDQEFVEYTREGIRQAIDRWIRDNKYLFRDFAKDAVTRIVDQNRNEILTVAREGLDQEQISKLVADAVSYRVTESIKNGLEEYV